ncbi:hypothetical protein PA598K_04456 [Paenibacillus sp. 598K]|nr:hypothetical protein PA598K_04456 [Paenibacillus sp. 598K]
MLRSDHYYCVGCGRMEKLEEAQVLFRTGFFKIIHPLGCCAVCGEQENGMQDLSNPLADSAPLQDRQHPPIYPYKERKELAWAF